MSKVVVIGGGAAGMLAALKAAKDGHEVCILERNEKLGKKVYITGKGRCNVTNDTDVEMLLRNVVSNPKFLYSAFYGFTSQDMIALLEEEGLPLKTERGNRVFPVSDKSNDVIRTLQKALKNNNVKIEYHARVTEIVVKEGKVEAVVWKKEMEEKEENLLQFRESKKQENREKCQVAIVATGGVSYPSTGSTGDGYVFAKENGLKITTPVPALVPLETKESYIKEMQGLSLKNVKLTAVVNGRQVFEEFGEMLFTHFGISGPLVLSASSYVGKYLNKGLKMYIDLKPALSEKQLDERLLRDFKENANCYFKNSLSKLLPAKMIPVVVALSEIPPEKKVNEITKKERENLLMLLKKFPMTVTGTRQFREAIITQGGVHVKEIDPATMEAKTVQGLRFAGEVLDLDAVTGGYNLQIAWSTGYAAGTIY